MTVRFTYTQGAFKTAFAAHRTSMARAASEAMRTAATQIRSRGRAAIAAAGLPADWQMGFDAKVYPTGGDSLKAQLWVTGKGPLAVFEFGATIAGKPMLWIPVSGLPKGETPQSYGAPLYSVNRPGYPPMLAGGPPGHMVILFIGLTAVEIKKKLDLEAIVQAAADGLPATFASNLEG